MIKNVKLRCPYCNLNTYLHLSGEGYCIDEDATKPDGYNLLGGFCPSCDKFIVFIEHGQDVDFSDEIEAVKIDECNIIYPKHSNSRPLEESIPQTYIDCFREAEAVLEISPKASATLSRYLLQMILHEELNIKKRNLDEELTTLEQLQVVSSDLIIMLQLMRKVANFGAHPKKSTNSKEILEVEPGEAEIMLDLLEELFDCTFVKPKKKHDFLISAKEKYGIEI